MLLQFSAIPKLQKQIEENVNRLKIIREKEDKEREERIKIAVENKLKEEENERKELKEYVRLKQKEIEEKKRLKKGEESDTEDKSLERPINTQNRLTGRRHQSSDNPVECVICSIM